MLAKVADIELKVVSCSNRDLLCCFQSKLCQHCILDVRRHSFLLLTNAPENFSRKAFLSCRASRRAMRSSDFRVVVHSSRP